MSYTIGDVIEYKTGNIGTKVGEILKFYDERARVKNEDGKTTWIKNDEIIKIISKAATSNSLAATITTTITSSLNMTPKQTEIFATRPEILIYGSDDAWNKQAQYIFEFGATTLTDGSQFIKDVSSEHFSSKIKNQLFTKLVPWDYPTLLDIVLVIDTKPKHNNESRLLGAACIGRENWKSTTTATTKSSSNNNGKIASKKASIPKFPPPRPDDTEIQRIIDVCKSADKSIRMNCEQKYAFYMCAIKILKRHFPSFLCRIIFNLAIVMEEDYYGQGVDCGELGYNMFGHRIMIRSARQGFGGVVLTGRSINTKQPEQTSSSLRVDQICTPKGVDQTGYMARNHFSKLYYLPHRDVVIANIAFFGKHLFSNQTNVMMDFIMNAYVDRTVRYGSFDELPLYDGTTLSSRFVHGRTFMKKQEDWWMKKVIKKLNE
jgi:hypothetical protein